MDNGPVSQQQADILDAWRSGQFNLWAQLEPLVEAAITKRLIAFRAAILRGDEIPELRSAKGLREQLEQAGVLGRGIEEEATKRMAEVRRGEEEALKRRRGEEEALKRMAEVVAEVWYATGMKPCP